MPKELNQTQKMMIAAIKAELSRTEILYLKTQDPTEAKKLNDRMNMLEEQLKNAVKPVNRTPEEVEQINKIVKGIKENAEIEGVDVKGTRSDKKLTPKEEFEYKLKTYVQEMQNKVVQAKKADAVYTEIAEILENREPYSEESFYKAFVKDLRERIAVIEKSITVMEDKIEKADEEIKLLLDNFDLIHRMNDFLNNPLALSDIE